MQQRQQQSMEHSRREDWLHTGIYVRVMNKKLGNGKYYKEKGVVRRVHDTWVAEIEMSRSSFAAARVKLDQQELETVVPKPGKAVLFVNGVHRGKRGTLLELLEHDYQCKVRLDGAGRATGSEETCLAEYEDISRCD